MKERIVKLALVEDKYDDDNVWESADEIDKKTVKRFAEIELYSCLEEAKKQNTYVAKIKDINGKSLNVKSWILNKIKIAQARIDRNNSKKRKGLIKPIELVEKYFTGKGFMSFPGAQSYWANNEENCCFGSLFDNNHLYILMFNVSGNYFIYGITDLKDSLYGTQYTLQELEREIGDIENKVTWYNIDYYNKFIKKEMLNGLNN